MANGQLLGQHGWLRRSTAFGLPLEEGVPVPAGDDAGRMLAGLDLDRARRTGTRPVHSVPPRGHPLRLARVLAIVVGPRRGEPAWLRWHHVDLDRGTLLVHGNAPPPVVVLW